MSIVGASRWLLLFVSACSAPSTQPAAASAVVDVEASKDADAFDVELVSDAEDFAVAELRAQLARSSKLKLANGAVGNDARRLKLRFSAGAPSTSSKGLQRELSLTGFTQEGECQVFQLKPKLTKPGGRAEVDSDVKELTRAGIENLMLTLHSLLPKVGPNATCLSTGK